MQGGEVIILPDARGYPLLRANLHGGADVGCASPGR